MTTIDTYRADTPAVDLLASFGTHPAVARQNIHGIRQDIERSGLDFARWYWVDRVGIRLPLFRQIVKILEPNLVIPANCSPESLPDAT